VHHKKVPLMYAVICFNRSKSHDYVAAYRSEKRSARQLAQKLNARAVAKGGLNAPLYFTIRCAKKGDSWEAGCASNT